MHCSVYVIGSPSGPQKIGCTSRPIEVRRAEHEQQDRKRELIIYKCSPVAADDRQSIEQIAHFYAGEYLSRVEGFDRTREWFDVSPDEACHAVALAVSTAEFGFRNENGYLASLWEHYPKPTRKLRPPQKSYSQRIREGNAAWRYLSELRQVELGDVSVEEVEKFISQSPIWPLIRGSLEAAHAFSPPMWQQRDLPKEPDLEMLTAGWGKTHRLDTVIGRKKAERDFARLRAVLRAVMQRQDRC